MLWSGRTARANILAARPHHTNGFYSVACGRLGIGEQDFKDKRTPLLRKRAQYLNGLVEKELADIGRNGLTQFEQLLYPDISTSTCFTNRICAKQLMSQLQDQSAIWNRIGKHSDSPLHLRANTAESAPCNAQRRAIATPRDPAQSVKRQRMLVFEPVKQEQLVYYTNEPHV
jgi:hypothetical protein